MSGRRVAIWLKLDMLDLDPDTLTPPLPLHFSLQRAGEEGRKVAEVAFINQISGQLTEEDKKLSLQQKQEEWEARMR